MVIARRLSGVVAISCIRLLRRLLQSLLLLRNDITTQSASMRGTRRELSFFAEDQFNRNLVKPEFTADGIHQVALIRKVNAFGVGDKEDKSGRLNARL